MNKYVSEKFLLIFLKLKKNSLNKMKKIIMKKECLSALSIAIGFRHSHVGVNFGGVLLNIEFKSYWN